MFSLSGMYNSPTKIAQGPGEPASAAGQLTPVQEAEGEPERAPGGSRSIAQAQ